MSDIPVALRAEVVSRAVGRDQGLDEDRAERLAVLTREGGNDPSDGLGELDRIANDEAEEPACV